MKNRSYWIGLIMLLAMSVTQGASRTSPRFLASYIDGMAADDAALRNLATASYCSANGLEAVGFDGGAMVTRSEFGRSGLTPAGSTARSSTGSEWLFARSTSIDDTPESTSDYFGLIVIADTGKTLALTNLTFDLTSVANDDTATGTTYTAQVFVAVDGGDFAPVGDPVRSTVGARGWGALTSANIDLSSITGASSVEIRIALGDGGCKSTSGAAFVQGIQAKGSVIP